MLSLRGSILISVCVHLGFFLAFLLISRPGGAKVIYKPQYQVRLVQPDEIPSLSKPKRKAAPKPKPAAAAEPPKSKVTLPEKKKEEKPKAPVPVKKTPEKPKPVVRPEEVSPTESVKKETAEKPPPKVAEPAQPTPEPEPQKVLDDVLARIKKKVGARKQVAANRRTTPESGWEKRQKEMEYRRYYDLVDQRVYENWIPPPNTDLNNQDLMTVVAITMLPDGRILKSFIEESSGNPLFDQTVMRAILKSNPLPPPPIGLDQQSYELGLNFYSTPRFR